MRAKAQRKKTTRKNSKRKPAPKKKSAARTPRKKPASKPDPVPIRRPEPDPEPGLYARVPRETYFGWDYANKSFLDLFEKTAAHALVERQHPKAPTPAKILGTHIHLATLSEDLDSYAICAPINPKTGKQYDRRTTLGVLAWAEAEKEARGRQILSVNDFNTCKTIRAACRADPACNEILSGEGSNELAVVWDDIETGVRCKALIDRLTTHEGWSCVVDLKSTLDASPEGWPYQAERYRLARQAAFYLDGIATATDDNRPRRFIFMAIEKMVGPPYTVGGPMVYVPSDSVIEKGRSEYRALLKRYNWAIKTGEWPGYPRGLQWFHLPERAYGRYMEDE